MMRGAADNQEDINSAVETARPKVSLEEKFSYRITRDVVYAKALSHIYWGSNGEAQEMDLLLDVYQPVIKETTTTTEEVMLNNCPAVLLIYGGGFMLGSKEMNIEETAMARDYARRGFVVFVPNYRLVRHRGTIPRSMEVLAIPGNIMIFLLSLPIFAAVFELVTDVLKYIERLVCFHRILKYVTGALRAEASIAELGVTTAIQNICGIYPAGRDCKAAVRWLHAHGAEYGVNTNYITAAGGSSGGMLATMLGFTTEDQYRDEISLDEDPTLSTTHLSSRADVHTVINGFGGPFMADFINVLHGGKTYSLSKKYPPTLSLHHFFDPIVPYPASFKLEGLLRSLGTPHELHTVPYVGHIANKVRINGLKFHEIAMRFIIKHQKLDLDQP